MVSESYEHLRRQELGGRGTGFILSEGGDSGIAFTDTVQQGDFKGTGTRDCNSVLSGMV
jgi:hypothetical protein